MQRSGHFAAHDAGSSAGMATTGSSNSTASYGSQPVRMRRPDAKRKMVCVGDGGCGKTCMLIVYAEQRFPEDYVPTVFENYITNVDYNDKLVELSLWDTAGQEEYDRLRPLSYPESNVILMVFSVDYPTSLENIEDKWHPEVVHFCEGVPIILIATKIDLRNDKRTRDLLAAQGRQPVTQAEGEAVAKRIGARYAECSAREGRGIDELFALAIKVAMNGSGKLVSGGGRVRRRNPCKIL